MKENSPTSFVFYRISFQFRSAKRKCASDKQTKLVFVALISLVRDDKREQERERARVYLANSSVHEYRPYLPNFQPSYLQTFKLFTTTDSPGRTL